MGKGDTPRSVNKERYDANFERIFGKCKIKNWKDAPGNKEGDGEVDGSSNRVPKESGGRTDPKAPTVMERARSGSTCPMCWWKVYRRRGFDYEYICPNCNWVGELQ